MIRFLIALTAILTSTASLAEETVLNIYSARHYQVDEALYDNFTQQTGIRIKRIEGKAHELTERIRNEGANSPADIFISADAATLAVADAWGLLAPLRSTVLVERIPAHLRAPTWAAFALRARLIIYNKRKLKAEDVPTYESLADPKLKGLVCSTPGGHIYNLVLTSALVTHNGEAATEQWARSVASNLARPPRGGDTDQIKSVASGECGVAVSNSYYLARLMASERVEERNLVKRLGLVWPNQASWGTHVNVSGAGIVKTAPHAGAAQRFIEYLASDAAQRHFAVANNEWPVVSTVTVDNPELAEMGGFKADRTPLTEIARQMVVAQKLLDRAGYR